MRRGAQLHSGRLAARLVNINTQREVDKIHARGAGVGPRAGFPSTSLLSFGRVVPAPPSLGRRPAAMRPGLPYTQHPDRQPLAGLRRAAATARRSGFFPFESDGASVTLRQSQTLRAEDGSERSRQAERTAAQCGHRIDAPGVVLRSRHYSQRGRA